MTNLLFLMALPLALLFSDPADIRTVTSGDRVAETLHLAKGLSKSFKKAAAPKPPVARRKLVRARPVARKSTARPAPAPKGFSTLMSPGGRKIARAGTSRRQQLGNLRNGMRNGTRGRLSQRAFNPAAGRGSLRPKFYSRARPKANPALGRNGSRGGKGFRLRTAAGAAPPPGKGGLTPIFNRASGATAARRSAVAKQAALRPPLRPTFKRAVQRGRATQAFRKSARYPGAAGRIRNRLTREGEVFWRSYGGSSGRSGRYASLIRPNTAKHARRNWALPRGNNARYLSRYVSPGGEPVRISRTAPAFGRPGGGIQAYFPTAPKFGRAGWNRGGLTELFHGVN